MAQRRRNNVRMKRRQQLITLLCIAGGLLAVVLSLLISILIFDPFPAGTTVTAPVTTSPPYDAGVPFSISDLTGAQISQIRRDGRMYVSDGPRGVSIGDSLEKLLERYPTDYAGDHPEDAEILYCASFFENQNGLMTVLPPRGLLTVDNGEIIVTLLAPTSAYPAGTLDSYGSYEHVYCLYTIEPDTMTISSIILGIDQ